MSISFSPSKNRAGEAPGEFRWLFPAAFSTAALVHQRGRVDLW